MSTAPTTPSLEPHLPVGAEIELPPCLICRGESAHVVLRVPLTDSYLVKCQDCGLGQLHPMPDEAAIRHFYPDAYYGDGGQKFTATIE